jgi:hypothetical protein
MESFILERSWKELILMGGQYLVYRVDDGYGSALLFFDIRNQEITPYDFVWAAVAGGANVNYFRPQVLVSTINRQILVISHPGEKDQLPDIPMVLQVFHGFNQPLDRMRLRMPIPNEHGELPNTEIAGPTLGNPFGWWFEGHESPYDNPTGRGMFMVLERMELELGLEHRTDIIVTPSSSFIINKLEVHPLNPSDDIDRKTIADILLGKVRSKYWTPGLQGVPYREETIKAAYGVEGVYWNGKKAKTPSGTVVI